MCARARCAPQQFLKRFIALKLGLERLHSLPKRSQLICLPQIACTQHLPHQVAGGGKYERSKASSPARVCVRTPKRGQSLRVASP